LATRGCRGVVGAGLPRRVGTVERLREEEVREDGEDVCAERGVVLSPIGAGDRIYLCFVVPSLFDPPPHFYAVVDELARMTMGVLGLLVYATSRLPETERSAAGPRA